MPPAAENPELAEAIITQWTFKSDAMRAMTLTVCRLALAPVHADGHAVSFSSNDLPKFAHGGPGIAGSIFHTLANRGVLTPVGEFVGGRFVPRYVPNAGGNPVRLWRLKSAALAQALLRAHGQAVPTPVQADLSLV